MSQYTINIGALPNDGTGDPLRTAFNEVNLNFNQVWATGLVNSNVQVANNTILTTNTNGNLVLAPNGVGVVQSNVSIVPNTSNIRSLGSSTQRWSSLYIQYANISGNLDLAGEFSVGDMTVTGNLTVTGNTIQIGNIVTETLTIQLGNAATTANAANGAGITVGANDNIATLLYNGTGNVWTTNIGVSVTGNVTGNYFIGNGSQLTGVTASGVAASALTGNTLSSNVLFSSLTSVGTLANLSVSGNVTGGNVLTGGLISATGNITGNYILGNISQASGFPATYGNANVATFLSAFGSNTISTTGNITVGNILPAGYVSAVGNVRGANFNTVGTVSATGNVTGNYILGNGSQLTSLPAPTVTQDITSNGAMSIMTYDGVIKYVSYATVEPSSGNITGGNIRTTGVVTATGNITGNYFIGNGSQLTGIGASSNKIFNGNSYANIASADGNLVVNVGNDGYGIWTFAAGTGNLVGPGNASQGAGIVFSADQSVYIREDMGELKIDSGSGIEITTNSGNVGNTQSWTFGADGSVIFPTLTVNLHNGGDQSGQVLQLGDPAQQAIITGPTPSANVNAQRLIIQGQAGNGAGEGGDVYLWAGDAENNGGDIKIYAGDADSGTAGDLGGYINIDGGAGYTRGGQVEITGGYSSSGNGGYANLLGGQGNTGGNIGIQAGYGQAGPGGAVAIQGGGSANGLAEYGNVSIAAGASTWTFNNTGNLTVPGNILGSGNILIAPNSASSSSYLDIYLTGGPDIHIASNDNSIVIGRDTGANVFVGNDGEVSIRTDNGATAQVWNFTDTGNLTAPGNISATGNVTGGNIVTAGTGGDIVLTGGNITGAGNISATGNITAANFIGNTFSLAQTILPTIQSIVSSNTSSEYETAGGSGYANVLVANVAPVIEYGVIVTAGSTVDKYVAGNLANIPGTEKITISTGTSDQPFTVYAYVTTNAGTYYSGPEVGFSGLCLLKGTMISLADGTYKPIEDINNDDLLLTWDFDLGRYAQARPLWIKRGETGTRYNELTFSDGTILRTFDQHRIFNKQAGAFTYPMSDDTPVGTVTINEHGQEITLVKRELVWDTIEHYNIITNYHINLFADSVLTSCRFNNIYPITDMKFVKSVVLNRNLSEFAEIESRFVSGLRLQEQSFKLAIIEGYVNRLLATEATESIGV